MRESRRKIPALPLEPPEFMHGEVPDASSFDIDPFEPQPDGVGTIFPLHQRGVPGRAPSASQGSLPDRARPGLKFGRLDPP
jgi:hypothetical protein